MGCQECPGVWGVRSSRCLQSLGTPARFSGRVLLTGAHKEKGKDIIVQGDSTAQPSLMLFAAVLKQRHTEGIGMRRAILHALRSRNSLPAAVIESVRSWPQTDAPLLSAEARDFMATLSIDASP